MRVTSIDDLPPARAVLCDLSPRPLLRDRRRTGFRHRYRRALERYRYGMGVFKVDWALDGPIPWRAAPCARAATVHLGGTLERSRASERDAWEGRIAERPFVLLVAADAVRSDARAGRPPHGVGVLPRAARIDRRHAAAHRAADRALRAGLSRPRPRARTSRTPADIERHNANLVGGDIGMPASTDLAPARSRARRGATTRTPVRGLYLCSAVDAARRRRARHVRVSRGAGGAAGNGIVI